MTRTLVFVLVLHCWCSHRQRCRAPRGWYVNGAQPSGAFRLDPVLGRAQDDIEDGRRRRELAGPEPVLGRIHCTGGGTPRQDGESVWCQRP